MIFNLLKSKSYSSSSHYILHLDYNNVEELPIYMPYEKVTIYDITPLQKKRKERGSQSPYMETYSVTPCSGSITNLKAGQCWYVCRGE